MSTASYDDRRTVAERLWDGEDAGGALVDLVDRMEACARRPNKDRVETLEENNLLLESAAAIRAMIQYKRVLR